MAFLKSLLRLNKFRDIYFFDLIGKEIEVVDSENPSYIGIYGIVIDETKNTLKVKTEDGTKTIIKDKCKFLIYMENSTILLDGKLITKRPWERIKSKLIKW